MSLKEIIKNSHFIQNIASFFINLIPSYVTHNLHKYKTIKNVIETAYMDSIHGDYLEFGTLTGSSLNHTINCFNKYNKADQRNIFCFDSFEGFPEINHKIFNNEDFIGDYQKVLKISLRYNKCKIVKGFFNETLKNEDIQMQIKNVAIVFIDCDYAKSSKIVFEFIKTRLSYGALLIIDDFYNIDYNKNSIMREFKKQFDKDQYEIISSFGLNGIVIRYFE